MSKKGGFLAGLTFGAIATAITGLLLSEKSGKQIKEEIEEALNDFNDENTDKKEYIKYQAQVARQRVLDKLNTINEETKPLQEQTKEQLESLQEKAKIQVDKIQQQVKEKYQAFSNENNEDEVDFSNVKEESKNILD